MPKHAEAIFIGDDRNWWRWTTDLWAMEPTDATSHNASITFIAGVIRKSKSEVSRMASS